MVTLTRFELVNNAVKGRRVIRFTIEPCRDALRYYSKPIYLTSIMNFFCSAALVSVNSNKNIIIYLYLINYWYCKIKLLGGNAVSKPDNFEIEELDIEKNSLLGVPVLSEITKVKELVK